MTANTRVRGPRRVSRSSSIRRPLSSNTSDPLSWNRCKDLLKSNAAYVAAPSVTLYLQHFKRFAGGHVASTKLLQDRPAPKRGHFKTAYSAEALCWVCGSASHDLCDCKMLTSALADYKSKHLHKGNSRGNGRNFTSRGRPSGRGGFTSRNCRLFFKRSLVLR